MQYVHLINKYPQVISSNSVLNLSSEFHQTPVFLSTIRSILRRLLWSSLHFTRRQLEKFGGEVEHQQGVSAAHRQQLLEVGWRREHGSQTNALSVVQNFTQSLR